MRGSISHCALFFFFSLSLCLTLEEESLGLLDDLESPFLCSDSIPEEDNWSSSIPVKPFFYAKTSSSHSLKQGNLYPFLHLHFFNKK